MRVSAIVCTFNRAGLLPRLISTVAAQLRDGDEVIVVDNGSTDDTAAVVARSAGGSPAIRYVLEREQGLSHARNRGVRESRGEIVAFLDDDALPEPGWLAAHRRCYEDEQVGAAGGPIELLLESERPNWLCADFEQLLGCYDLGPERRFYGEGQGHDTPSGGNMSFRRAALDQIGLFDTELGRRGDAFLAGEEYELVHRLFRAGWRGVYEPQAVVTHLVPAERLRVSFFRNRMRSTVSTSQLLGRKGFARPRLRAELRNLAANIVLDSLRTVGGRGGSRLYHALRVEVHLLAMWRRLVWVARPEA